MMHRCLRPLMSHEVVDSLKVYRETTAERTKKKHCATFPVVTRLRSDDLEFTRKHLQIKSRKKKRRKKLKCGVAQVNSHGRYNGEEVKGRKSSEPVSEVVWT